MVGTPHLVPFGTVTVVVPGPHCPWHPSFHGQCGAPPVARAGPLGHRFTVKGPVTSQSGLVLPSPVPFTSSLLLIAVTGRPGRRHSCPWASTATVTGTIGGSAA